MDLLALGGSAARASKFDEAERCLYRFRLLFNEHLLDKNLRLYTYLGCCLRSDSEGLEFMRHMRRETGEISRQTTRFLSRCQEVGISEERRDEFLDELALIEDLLRHCFIREERSLYPMYRSPRSYQAAPAQSSSIGQRTRSALLTARRARWQPCDNRQDHRKVSPAGRCGIGNHGGGTLKCSNHSASMCHRR